jgi:hypothetical protein
MTWAVNWAESDRNRKCWDLLVRKANSYAELNQYSKYAKYYNTLKFYRSCLGSL